MTITEILSLLNHHGISLRVENHSLRYHAPKGALNPDLRKLLTENRGNILAYLEKGPKSAEIYKLIAVIGMAGRFPGATSINHFWENLRNGVESIRRFTKEELDAMGVLPEIYNASNFIKAAPMLDNVDMFDATFFGYSPREAEIIDPQQRLFLECASNALEHAGYDPGSYHGKIGVFGGAGSNYYGGGHAAKTGNNNVVETYQWELGNENDYLATRVAYKLGLKGPSLTIQTACSTSLVAAHVACQNLFAYQCDIALAGGVSVNTRIKGGYFYEEGMILSPDGHCRAFDANGKGTVGGQGVGIVVLKRLSDAVADGDNIYAVIRGSAINNDGAAKVGFTAPSVAGQSEVIVASQTAAGVIPENISYIEAHGTATPLGDPIEIKALTNAFRLSTDKKGFCAIGSVKTNIGHLDAAAGVAGLIKTVLMLEHREIPPSLHFEKPNLNLDLDNSPFFVNTKLREWQSDGTPRLAGVSAFGLGGTNAHMVVEEAPHLEATGPSRALQPLLFSARTEMALNTLIANMADHLEQNPELNLADVAFTLQIGRRAFAHRGTVVCRDVEDTIAALHSTNPQRVTSMICETGHRDIVFMFSGQGSQYANMGLDLYKEEPVFREQIDNCSEILKQEISVDLRQLLYPAQDQIEEAENKLMQTSITQPALFTIEFALAKLWMAWGIRPQAFVGHSIGEYVAACLADVFSLEDALKLVATRGSLMQGMPPGSMLAVFLPEEQLAAFINDDLSLSVINSPSLCVVSGTSSAIDSLESMLSKQQVMSRRLHTSHAFHSKMMDPILAPFAEQVKQVGPKPPRIPFLSNVTGTWITPEEATDPGYWAGHLRGTVRFADCVKELLTEPNRVLLEVGPGNTLSMIANQHPAKKQSHVILSSTRLPKKQQSDSAFILNTLCALWRAGISFDWMAFHAGSRRRRVPLPTYPFEYKSYWIEAQNLEPLSTSGVTGKQQLGESKCQASGENESIERDCSNWKESGKGTQEGKDNEDNNKNRHNHTSRSEVEQTLTDIWRDLLGHAEINLNDNFFALGGHSLAAVRLFAKIESIFGKRLPMATLISAPTVMQLTDLIVQDNFTASWSSLVKIRAEGTKPPFFSIHSEGGNILEYFKFAGYLNQDRPFYGIQAHGLEGKNIVSLSIEEMARHYISEIKANQPQGPYFIGGYCLGGMVAFEMARQLEAMGDSVAFLAMISTYTPDHLKREIPGMTTARRLLYNVLERVELEIDNLSTFNMKERLYYIGDRLRRMELTCAVIYQDLADFLQRVLHLKPYRHSRRYFLEKTRKAQSRAFYAFNPSTIKTKITLFRTSAQPRSLIYDPTLGWAKYSEKGVFDIEVRAFHKNILKDPNVKALAQKFQQCLDEPQSSLNND
jgi:phthiocerol/phenolphthiocerol synthesis type-I polyketide synthase E